MAVAPVVPVLLILSIVKCRCEPTNGHNHNNANEASKFGHLLKPPPLPFIPMPFHGGIGKVQRQNNEFGYQYQPPAPIQTSSALPISEFKFPAPFYKQYNFNFVPPPQPFSTTPSPNFFQKISGWLFPSQQTSSDLESLGDNNYNIPPLKKECNPCNLVPWIPVIRYDLSAKNVRQNVNPTYGPPSPTASTTFNVGQNIQQSINSHSNSINHDFGTYSTGVPHTSYGPPTSSHIIQSHPNRFPSSTYGPPSPTHIVPVSNQPLSSPFSVSSSSSSSFGVPNLSYGIPSKTKVEQYPSFATPSVAHENHFASTTHSPISSVYKPEVLNQHLPNQNDVEILSEIEPSKELQLPKVAHPTGFRNSYGEPIVNTYALDIPYSVPFIDNDPPKVKTDFITNSFTKQRGPNMSLALANPAPFSLNRGRNIHTLQPVALPNLSVSPLPPIFNARPFRAVTTPKYYPNINQGINYDHFQQNNINIAQSIPVAEYTHSIEYPTTIIQSPVIDIDATKNLNHTKGYRNIQNSYIIDEIRDISPQASEDHISAAKSNQDSSFESIGPDFNNDLYDSGVPLDIKSSSNVPFNHKSSFADLRGVKDEDVDKYRTESNLQHIDSPLLYLKPSAPHKNYKKFAFISSTPGKENEYEIYDDIPTTTISSQPTLTSGWEETRTYYTEDLSPPTAEQDNNDRPKIVQIIVPYTTGQRSDQNNNNFGTQQEWMSNIEKEYQARKIQPNTENSFVSIVTEGYNSPSTTTETPLPSVTEYYDTERLNTPAILNDLYDVKEPPFDIIKLQHTIDDWTEQEYSKHYKSSQKTRSNEKFAKQIPDDFFTTVSPVSNYATDNYNFDLYDHEGSSSMQHAVADDKTNIFSINRKDIYNAIERTKSNHDSGKNAESEGNKKLHIYTAASTFRSAKPTTTPAPWGQIQTSISPLTNEKVYVVTSKPWREKNLTKEYDYEVNKHESKEIELEIYTSDSNSDDLPFKSPRFSNRPPYGFTAESKESIKYDSPYGFSNGWHRRINQLENQSISENSSDEETSADQDQNKNVEKEE